MYFQAKNTLKNNHNQTLKHLEVESTFRQNLNFVLLQIFLKYFFYCFDVLMSKIKFKKNKKTLF